METRTAPADPEVLTSNLRVALDGRFGPIRDAAREYLNRADLLPTHR